MIALNVKISEEQKEKFRKPFGKIFNSIDEIRIPSHSKLITVGDIVSYNAIKANLSPDIIVYDKKNKRDFVDKEIHRTLELFQGQEFSVRNPAGSITDDLWKTVKKILKLKTKVKLIVDGEEDLAGIPFMIESPDDTVMLYGLKDNGVFVKVNKNIKEECKEILKSIKGP